FPALHRRVFPATDAFGDELRELSRTHEAVTLNLEVMDRLAFLPPSARAPFCVTIAMLQEGLRSLLHRNDRIGMLARIESRFPFLDESLVRFGINLLAKYKGAWTFRLYNYKHPFVVDKPIVRSIAQHYLPRKIAYRQKVGFPSPGLRELRVRAEFFDEGYLAR